MIAPKILVGIPTLEYARRALFYDYLNQLKLPPNSFIMGVHGQSPAQSRNVMIKQALKDDCTHVLFIDDDMAFESDMAERLLAHDLDVVSALYFMRNYPHSPIIFDLVLPDGRARHYYLKDSDQGLMQIIASGLGACLIKTDVFRAISPPWVTLGELDPETWCDDLAFFAKVRDAGFNIWCDLDIKVGHMCSVTVWPNKQAGKWFTTYDTNGIGMVSFPCIDLIKEQEKQKEMANV